MEVYDNVFDYSGTGSGASWRAICCRGGSGVVYNNIFHENWGQRIQLVCARACYYYSWCGLIAYGNSLDNVDGGTDAEGWPGRDQIGRGIDNIDWATFPTGTPSTQASQPFYQWNNTVNESAINAQINDSYYPCTRQTYMIVEGRDYYDQTQMPGYSALTYPHPLQGAASNNPWIMVYG